MRGTRGEESSLVIIVKKLIYDGKIFYVYIIYVTNIYIYISTYINIEYIRLE